MDRIWTITGDDFIETRMHGMDSRESERGIRELDAFAFELRGYVAEAGYLGIVEDEYGTIDREKVRKMAGAVGYEPKTNAVRNRQYYYFKDLNDAVKAAEAVMG